MILNSIFITSICYIYIHIYRDDLLKLQDIDYLLGMRYCENINKNLDLISSCPSCPS